MHFRTIPVLFVALVVAACFGGGSPTEPSTVPAGAESPRAAVESLVAALSEADWEATAPVVYEDQLALLASIEGVTAPETATMLAEGVPEAVRANFWEGFVDGFPVFAEEDVSDLQLGDTEVFTVDGAEFGAVAVAYRHSAGAGSWVARAENGLWRVDMFATFGPSFANPLREWLESVADDEHGQLIREAVAAQAPSFNSALTYEPLGELPTDVKFEIQLLMVEATG